MKYLRVFTSVFIVSTLLFGWMHFVLAQTTASDDINLLNEEIEFKQRSIDQLNRQIEEYRKKLTDFVASFLPFIVQTGLVYLSPVSQVEGFSKGVVDVRSLYYFLSFVMVFLFLNRPSNTP